MFISDKSHQTRGKCFAAVTQWPPLTIPFPLHTNRDENTVVPHLRQTKESSPHCWRFFCAYFLFGFITCQTFTSDGLAAKAQLKVRYRGPCQASEFVSIPRQSSECSPHQDTANQLNYDMKKM